MKTVRSYQVCINLESNEFLKYDFEKAFLNDEPNSNETNKALLEALDYLNKLESDRKVGILICHHLCHNYGNGYIGDGSIFNDYGHISHDKSNWVTVSEAIEKIQSIRNWKI